MKRWIPVLLCGALCAAAPQARRVIAPKFSLADSSGATHTEAEWSKASGVVLYFITTDCPISNGYVPEMNRIAQDYQARGVRFYGVIADTDTPLEEVRKHGLEISVLAERRFMTERLAIFRLQTPRQRSTA